MKGPTEPCLAAAAAAAAICQLETFLKLSCNLSRQIIFWTQILCSLSDAGESFAQQRWQKSFVDAAATAATAAAAVASVEAGFLCGSPALSILSANSSYRTPAKRVKCATALEQLRFDGFAARNENAASRELRAGDQSTTAAQLFTLFAF